jgi:hypothetical protein
MSASVWRVTAAMFAVIGIAGTAAAFAHTSTRWRAHAQHSGPLSGTWSGSIGSGPTRQRMQITINARETTGTWMISAGCHGALTLDSISDGYHHFRRHIARGSNCAGGDVDCLKRAGADLYDAVTSHRGGSWDTSGTLKRVRG